MASNIKFKRSSVQNRVPTTAQLDLGELALNTYDGKLYCEKNDGSASVVEIGQQLSVLVVDGDNGGGNGDVTFHGATANRDLLWDASADKLIAKDNTHIALGDDSDLSIYHNGSHSFLDNSTGILSLRSGQIRLKNADGSKSYIHCTIDEVELYRNNQLRITTTHDGADIGGTGSLKIPVGTTAQRSGSPTAGDLRYNSTTGGFEGYSASWGELGGGGIGIGSTSVNPGSGVIGHRVGVGFTDINFVGAGLSVTGYGSTVVVDIGNAVSRKYGRKIHSYTATANQTAFTGLSYTDGASQVSVYLNGAKLSAATYTATSGSTVVLGTGASVGDEVEILVIDSGVDISRTVHSYTATANQTVFSGLGYEDGGDLDVYLNGIRLAQSDYTANNGTILTLAAGASVGDLLEIVDMGPGAEWKSGFGADTDDIFRMNGGVGIGTTNPTDKLNIVGNVEILGILTATTFSGVDTDKIEEGNTSVETVDTGSNGHIKFTPEGTERVRIDSSALKFTSNVTSTPSASGNVHIYRHDNILKMCGASGIRFDEGGHQRWIIQNGDLHPHGTTYNNLGNSTNRVGNAFIQTSVDLVDSAELRIGSSDDLKLLHNGTDSVINNTTGSLLIQDGGTTKITVTSATTTVANNLTVTGNLQVDGTQTTVNSTTMTVDDKNIVLGSGAANDAAADGGGITLESGNGNKTWNWVDANDAWTSSEHIHMGDDKKLYLGGTKDFELFHDHSNQWNVMGLVSGSALPIVVGAQEVYIKGVARSSNMAIFRATGATDLMHGGTKKFETTSTGISVTGQGVFSGTITASTYIQGTSSNGGLKFYSDSSTSKGVVLDTNDHLVPTHDSNSDLGLTGTRWRNVYADTLYGDGSNLTGITQTAINNNANNRVITGSGTANTLEGEANLTYDGTTLGVNGLTNTGGQNANGLTINRTDGLQLFGVNWNVSANEVSFSGNTKNYVFKNGSSSAETLRITSGGVVQIGGATSNSADIDTANTKFTIKQSANSREDGIYIERSGERRGWYQYVGGGLSSSDALCFDTNQLGTDTSVVALDRSGDVRIGDGKVLLGTTTAGQSGEADALTVYRAGHTGITIRTGGTSNNSAIYFADGTSGDQNYRGSVTYTHANDTLRLKAAATEILSVYSSGITVTSTGTSKIEGTSNANLLSLRNTTGGNGTVGMLFSTNATAGREKAGIFHVETSGSAHYEGDILICCDHNSGDAGQVTTAEERLRIKHSGEVKINDGGKFVVGTGDDLQLLHDSNGNNKILTSASLTIQTISGNQPIIDMTPGGAVKLYHNNSMKLETTSTGISVTGQGVFSAAITASTYIQGTSSNGGLKFYSDSSASKGVVLNTDDHLVPTHDSNSDLGTSSVRWRAIYGDSLNIDGTITHGSGVCTIHGMKFMSSGNSRNLKFEATGSGSSTDVGFTFYDYNSNWRMQLYGANNYYGFLDGNWSSWDVRKNVNGQLEIDAGSGLSTVWHAGNDGSGSGLDADTVDGIQGSAFCRSDATATITPSNGTDRVINANTSSGNGAFMAFQQNGTSHNYVGCAGGLGAGDKDDLGLRGGDRIIFLQDSTARAYFDSNGHFKPWGNNLYDLGDSGDKWRNIYTNDLNLSNEGSDGNSVDGSWGSYTIQEGEDDLFLINKRSGKKYKFMLQEVS